MSWSSSLKEEEKKKTAQAGIELSNLTPESSQARKDLPPVLSRRFRLRIKFVSLRDILVVSHEKGGSQQDE